MKFCKSCGTALEDSARFCERCGTQSPPLPPGLSNAAPPPQPPPGYGPPPGYPAPPPYGYYPPGYPPKPARRKTPLLMAVAVVVLLAVVLIAVNPFSAYGHLKGEEKQVGRRAAVFLEALAANDQAAALECLDPAAKRVIDYFAEFLGDDLYGGGEASAKLLKIDSVGIYEKDHTALVYYTMRVDGEESNDSIWMTRVGDEWYVDVVKTFSLFWLS